MISRFHIQLSRSFCLLLCATALSSLAALSTLQAAEATAAPATNSPSASETKPDEPQTITDAELGLTLGVPRGWKIQAFPHSRFPMAFGPQLDGVTPNINLDTETPPRDLTLAKYVDENQAELIKQIKDLRVLNREDFDTTSGVKGMKLTTESNQFNMVLRQNFYFFQAGPKSFVLITATAPSSSIQKLEAPFDDAVKTLTLKK